MSFLVKSQLINHYYPYLLSSGQGADPNTKNSGGVPLVCLAAKNRHFGAFKALVEGGADITAQVLLTSILALIGLLLLL